MARPGSTEEADSVELIVNATPQGMAGDLSLPVPASTLGSGQLVVDLVYHPVLTPLVEAARQRGAAAANGLGMLIHQAAHAFRLWTGEDPPLEVMRVVSARPTYWRLTALDTYDGHEWLLRAHPRAVATADRRRD